ncbi:MAG: peptide chain release factor N(5)-glutamine methyltransferase, partial [Blastocatellia bacterium]
MNQAIAEGSRRLEGAGERESRRTARILLGHALGRDQAALIAHPEDSVSLSRYQDFLALITRKELGEPLQHLTGHQEFFGLDFIVTPDVLIPRPETEFLVERVIKLAAHFHSNRMTEPGRPVTIADVGTGSGCIAVALAVSLPAARIIATDISQAALEIARENAERNGVAFKIEFAIGDLLEPLSELGLKGSVGIIASNPPYIPRSRPQIVEPQVRDFEPGIALFAGDDGLDFYKRLFGEGPEYLAPGGHMVFEMGYPQLDEISALIDPRVWETSDVIHDLQELPRIMT